MARNPAQVALTKQNLKDSFMILYKSKRINQITIKEITDKAGYNRGTFYLYYEDVYHILKEIEDEVLDELSDISHLMVKLLITSSSDSKEGSRFFNFFKDNIKYISVLLGENGDTYFQSRFKRLLKDSIEEYINYEVVDISETAVDFTLEFFISGIIGLILYYFTQDKEPNIDTLKKVSNTVLVQSKIIDLLKNPPSI